MAKHTHDFVDCGYDAQQCDNACRATHKCGICGKTREKLAKNLKQVRTHVKDQTKVLIKALQASLKSATNLQESVAAVAKIADALTYLSRQQLVELALGQESRADITRLS